MWIVLPLFLLAGFVDAIAGGGGLITLPSLLAIGLPPHFALGTNKFSATLGTSVATAYFIKKGHIFWPSALLAAGGALIGSALGAKIALLIDERILSWILLGIIPLVAVSVIFKRDIGGSEKHLSGNRTIVLSILVGFAIGAYDGFFGPGTGTFLIIAFTAVLGFNLLTACGNTKIVNLASNTAAFVTFTLSGHIDYRIGIPCAACTILGNVIGTRLAIKNGAKIVRPMMLVVIALLLVKVLWDLL